VRHLPEPQNLREAVKEVIRSNSADRYHPGRFIQATEAGEAKDLKRICEHMILNPDTLTWLVDALRTHASQIFRCPQGTMTRTPEGDSGLLVTLAPPVVV